MLFYNSGGEKNRSLQSNATPHFPLYYNPKIPNSTYLLRFLSLVPKATAMCRAYCTYEQPIDLFFYCRRRQQKGTSNIEQDQKNFEIQPEPHGLLLHQHYYAGGCGGICCTAMAY